MCLAVLSWQPGHDTPLQVVANRDEFRNRASQSMHWWQDLNILAGKDLEAGGTWLGFNKRGQFALLTNIRPGFVGVTKSLSRGELITDFLTANSTIEEFHNRISSKISQYSGFNLIIGNSEKLFWFSSTHPEGKWLEPGVHGLSNDSLNTPWPKTSLAITQMKKHAATMDKSLTDHPILSSLQRAQLNELPSTGVPIEWEHMLSAQTIIGEAYGTLCRTHFSMDKLGHFRVAEQQINSSGGTEDAALFTIAADVD